MAKDPWSYLALFHLPRIFFHLFCCVCIHGIPHPSRREPGWAITDLKQVSIQGWQVQNLGDCFCLFIKKKTFCSKLGDTGKISSDFLKSRLEGTLEPAGLIPFQCPPLPNTHLYIHWDICGKEPTVFSKLNTSPQTGTLIPLPKHQTNAQGKEKWKKFFPVRVVRPWHRLAIPGSVQG